MPDAPRPSGHTARDGTGARLSSRRRRRWHPDFDAGRTPPADDRVALADAAVDFVDLARIVDRMHAAFVKSLPH